MLPQIFEFYIEASTDQRAENTSFRVPHFSQIPEKKNAATTRSTLIGSPAVFAGSIRGGERICSRSIVFPPLNFTRYNYIYPYI